MKIFSVTSYSTSRPTRRPCVVDLGGEERGAVGRARGLLHVVGDDHDRELALELLHEVLDARGGDRVERRARLVHEHDVGLDRDRARDAQALLLAAGQREAAVLELVLHLVPQRGARQRVLDDVGHLRALARR